MARGRIIAAVITLLLIGVVAIFIASLQPVASLTFVSFTNNASGFTDAPFSFRYDTTNEPFSFAVLRLSNHSGRPIEFAPMSVRVPEGSDWVEWSVGSPGNRSWKQYKLTSSRDYPSLARKQQFTFPLMIPAGTNAWRFTILLPRYRSRWQKSCNELAGRLGLNLFPRFRSLTLTAPAMAVTEAKYEE